jgi:hypothetical protein
MNKEELLSLAKEFRSKMEAFIADLQYNHPHGLTLIREFPFGCCHDTSLLLARFLREQGVKRIKCVITSQHAFLQVIEWYVDITGDQFGKEFLPVEVVERSDPRYRQMILKTRPRRASADYRQYETELIQAFDAVYAEIMGLTVAPSKTIS